MAKSWTVLWASVLVLMNGLTPAATTKVVLRAHDHAGANLINAGAWRAMGPSVREGDVFVCDNSADDTAQRGFNQTVVLNQTVPTPIIATAESRSENAGGSANSDYALYLDVIYADNEPLWGQTAAFNIGTHDWQSVEVKVFPAKPIKEVHTHLLFRRHSGKALFRAPTFMQFGAGQNVAWFDRLPVQIKMPAPDGFEVRDVAADSDFVSFENGATLGLTLEQSVGKDGICRASLRDTTGKDRAISLIYSVPLAGTGWRWLESLRSEVPIAAPREYTDTTRSRAGTGSGLSRLPFAAVSNGERGVALAIDLDRPAFYRLGCSAGASALYIVYDLALTPERPGAEIAFCTLGFRGADGLRGAVVAYYQKFPEFFRCRTPKQGLWMPFSKISAVQSWEDFGFRFKEGNDETAWDDEHGIITFRYTEPMTWWMTMPKGTPRTLQGALDVARGLAQKGNVQAKALFSSGFHDAHGDFAAQIRREPWCDGAVWSMNSSPKIAGEVNDFQTKWSADIKEKLYGAKRKGDLDGEYIDSSEGYVTDELDFRREHFAAARAPLTFCTRDVKPVVLRGLIAYDDARSLAEDIHGMDKLMMANATPDHLCWLAPWLDVMGTETDWNGGGRWQPMNDAALLYRRMLCGPKPYCFLMNTNFERFSHELVEKYMKRCVAYGMFPGFFSHNASDSPYFTQPKLYNRDRDLFKKYVPLCQMVAEAGWQPLSGAHSDVKAVHVERFGEKILTVFNDSAQQQTATITWTSNAPRACSERVSGRKLSVDGGKLSVTMEPEDVWVLSADSN